MLWSMAASLRNMVTKKMKGGGTAGKEKQNLYMEEEKKVEHEEENNRKFDSFHDQLKQIRLSRDFLENNPQIAQQVLLNEKMADKGSGG